MNAVEIAIRNETDAIKFYTEAASKTRNTVGKKMFLSIAEDEKRHLDMLQQLLKNLDLNFTNASPMKAVKTIFAEMKELMMQRAEATKDELEAFKIAMEMEKEGVVSYQKAVL